MAYIREYRGKWRAEVQKAGRRESKVVDTEEEAKLWAAFAESAIDATSKRFRTRDRLVENGPDLVTMVPKLVLQACREIPHPQIDILEAAIPTRMASGVYFLLRGEDVVYVGQSVDVLGRISRHRREGKRFDAYSYMECSPDAMDRLERLYIKAFVPEENVSFGNHREQGPRPYAGRRISRPAAKADSLVSTSAPPSGTRAA